METLKGLKWTGTATGIAGALWIALNIATSGRGFSLFAISATCWTVAGRMMREPSLVLLHGVFLAINLLGIYRWLIA